MIQHIWQRAKRTIIMGVCGGAILGVIAGINLFGWLGSMGGLFLGMLLGATLGLDLVLVPLPAAGSRQRQPAPPFTTAIFFTLVGVAALLLSLYTWGGLTFTCQRSVGRRVDCQRTS